MAKLYTMNLNGFHGNIYKNEVVRILNTEYGVCHVETEDGIEDFVHMHDLEEVKSAERLSEQN